MKYWRFPRADSQGMYSLSFDRYLVLLKASVVLIILALQNKNILFLPKIKSGTHRRSIVQHREPSHLILRKQCGLECGLEFHNKRLIHWQPPGMFLMLAFDF